MPVAGQASTFENEWAVNSPIHANDETDFHRAPIRGRCEERIRSCKSLRWLYVRALETRADMLNAYELGGASQRPCDLMFALLQR
jgi:hypothetical protein